MSYKIIVFDLDGTLADLGCGISEENLSLLHRLEDQGLRIALCSGKTAFYLCGFLRQVQLKNPIILGENGAVIQMGIDLPPSEYYMLPYPKFVRKTLAKARQDIEEMLPGTFFQPNEVVLTPFLKTEKEFDLVQSYLDEHAEELKDVLIYRYVDCFDLIPKGLNKQAGLRYLSKLIDVDLSEMITVGNGDNDYPMFEVSGYSCGINLPDPSKACMDFSSLTEALEHILEKIEVK